MHFIPPPVLARDYAVRLSVTERCQLRCTYCMPEKGCSCARDTTREMSHREIVRLLGALHARFGVRRIRLTGGEPLLRRDLPDLVSAIRGLGLDDIALTTNGQLLARDAQALASAGLSRINVSIDSMDAEVFRRVTRGGVLARTLAGIDAALAAGLAPVKLNMVVLRGSNEQDVAAVLRHAVSLGCELRFLELMPIGAGGTRFGEEFFSSEDVRERLRAEGFGLEALPWDMRETSRDWRVTTPEGAQGVCGFISPTSQPFCDGCRRLRITSDGWLYGCLARDVKHDLSPVLEAANQLEAGDRWSEALGQALLSKQGEKYRDPIPTMSMIGG